MQNNEVNSPLTNVQYIHGNESKYFLNWSKYIG